VSYLSKRWLRSSIAIVAFVAWQQSAIAEQDCTGKLNCNPSDLPDCDTQKPVNGACEEGHGGPDLGQPDSHDGDNYTPPVIIVTPEDDGLDGNDGFNGDGIGDGVPSDIGTGDGDGGAVGSGVVNGETGAAINDQLEADSPVAEPPFPMIMQGGVDGQVGQVRANVSTNIDNLLVSVHANGVIITWQLWLTSVGGVPNAHPDSIQLTPQVYNAYGQEYGAAGSYNYAATGFVVARAALERIPSGYLVPDAAIELYLRAGSAFYQIVRGNWSNLNWYGEDKDDVEWIDKGIDRGKLEWERIRKVE
jgi:hypothetical protein